MRQTEFRAFSGETLSLPDVLRSGWALLEADGLHGSGTSVMARADIIHGGRAVETIALYPVGNGRFQAVLFLNSTAQSLRLRAFGVLADPGSVELHPPRWIGSPEAAWRILTRPGALRRLFCRPLPATVTGWKARLHESEAATIADLSISHPEWLATFATWSGDAAASGPITPGISFLVFSPDSSPALAATLASIRNARYTVVGPDDDWRTAAVELAVTRDGYLGLLAAGEVLVPDGLAIARSRLASQGLPAIAIADEDRLGPDGRRAAPIFKPEPNHALMLSGTLAQGLWLVRGDVATSLMQLAEAFGHAELARLDLWLSRWRQGSDTGRRLPVILTSRRHDAPPAPAERAAAIVDDHFTRAGLPLRAHPSWPVRLQPEPSAYRGHITALVPSTLKALHSEKCLRAILCETDAPDLEMIVAVSQPEPLDNLQREVAARLAETGTRVRVIHLPEPRFNFARTMNLASRETRSDRLLLLNDDVSPLSPDWLARMCAFLADSRVGIVGARLCYPDGRLQHAGIIMGFAGFCEHAFRNEPANASGYAGRAHLPQRLSAVTGACLLIEAELWRRLGGMDEGYPSAYNDIDLCLRVDELGREVVLSDATLTHYELQTYGSHFAGDRAAFEKAETARMRARWAARIADDPYYSPNLDLSPGHEWKPAVPPRLFPSFSDDLDLRNPHADQAPRSLWLPAGRSNPRHFR